MDLCWTSTSASAGEDFTIRAEWRSMALKVGYKALCNNNKIMHIAVSCQIKTLNLAKASFWELWKKEENNHLFWADSHTFCLKFLLQLWRGILGFVRLWNLKLQSREFDCSYCWNVYYVSILSSSGSHRWHSNHSSVGLCDSCVDVEHKVE